MNQLIVLLCLELELFLLEVVLAEQQVEDETQERHEDEGQDPDRGVSRVPPLEEHHVNYRGKVKDDHYRQ